MLVGIDRFVASVDDGVRVVGAHRPVQPWLCGETLLGGALWALWMDGVLDLTVRDGSVAEVRPGRRIAYPASSLERRLVGALSEQDENAVDLLVRTMYFTGARPWLDVIEVVADEIVDAGHLAMVTPPTRNGTARSTSPATHHALTAEIGPRWPATAVAEVSERWDTWWANGPDTLVAVGRACHDAIVIRRRDHAILVAGGVPLAGRRPPDPAEADAELARRHCPRWARRI